MRIPNNLPREAGAADQRTTLREPSHYSVEILNTEVADVGNQAQEENHGKRVTLIHAQTQGERFLLFLGQENLQNTLAIFVTSKIHFMGIILNLNLQTCI